MLEPNGPFADEVISIGAFRLLTSRRQLKKGDETVRLGSRALEVLVALAERPGEVVSQRDLIAKVWPNVFVEDTSLRVQIAALRKALDCDGARYVGTVAGRGYSLIAPVSRSTAEREPAPVAPAYPLLPPPAHLAGRDEDVRAICRKLLSQRFVTTVGAGGVGKTVTARSVAHALVEEFRGWVCFVELSPVDSPQLLAAAVASALRLRVQGNDPIPDVIAHLGDKRVLLVLDNCEHLIADAAVVSERLFREAPGLHILATSREALRTWGEHVHRLQPLSSPPEDGKLSAADVLEYPAAQLFADRMASAGLRDPLTDEDARIIGGMCRQLGGIALAIELAAGRVAGYGLRETASRLSTRLSLLWPGRRTAVPRQQTLNATLDWSYNLLSEAERAALRWLSVFAGAFSFQSARELACGSLEPTEADDALGGLVKKFLVSADVSGPTPLYRLLGTTRVYADGKLREAGEWGPARRRHALHYAERLRETARGDLADENAASAADIDDIRAALRWAFDEGGDARVGTDIAAYSAPLWLGRGLISDCRAWMARAAEAWINTDGAATEQQLRIQNALATAEQFTSGLTTETADALARTLERAESGGDFSTLFSSYLVLWGGQMRKHQLADALRTAEKCSARAIETEDPGTIAMSEWMLGHSKHHAGRFEEARGHLLRYLELDTEDARLAGLKATGFDRRADALTSLMHSLRNLGQLDEARTRGEQAIAAAQSLGLAVPVMVTSASLLSNTYLLESSIDIVECEAAKVLEMARAHSNHSDSGYALCIIGLCQAKRGEFIEGDRLVTEGLRTLKKRSLEYFIRAQLCETAIESGRSYYFSQLPDVEISEQNKVNWCSAELLRVNGVLAAAQGRHSDAEAYFLKALRLGRRQGALFWELRSTMSLCRLLAGRRHGREALALLETVYGRFTEGHTAPDLVKAKRLIEELRALSEEPVS
ncbi:MAG TPA: winged helix-turn-helix domain-containing protein [Caulobacteraceae bacterium]|nr:winged helix-turn-helix domain-containing protein [Caulobacteraceae bacterium]